MSNPSTATILMHFSMGLLLDELFELKRLDKPCVTICCKLINVTSSVSDTSHSAISSP